VSGSGVTIRDTAQQQAGVASLKCSNTTAGHLAQRHQDILMRAGEAAELEVYIRGDGASGGEAVLHNPTTNKYLNSGGGWETTAVAFGSRTAATWAKSPVAFNVESYSIVRGDVCRLRLTLRKAAASSGDAWFDEAALWPTTNFLSVHGHNLDPALTVEWRVSTDNFVSNNVLLRTLSALQPSFWPTATFPASSNARWHRLRLVGTNSPASDAVWIGEWVLAQAKAMQRLPNPGPEIEFEQAQVRHRLPTGGQRVVRLEEHRRRIWRSSFRFVDPAWRDEAYEVYERSSAGAHPLVVVPNDMEATVLYGLLPANRIERRHPDSASAVTDVDVELEESAFPTWMA